MHLTRQQLKTEFKPTDDQLLIEQHQLKKGEFSFFWIEDEGRVRYFLARWSEIQSFFPGRSCYTLQNRYRKLMQYRQINELFHSQQVFCFPSFY